MTDDAPPFRILPQLNANNRYFWQGGARHELVFLRCQDCGCYIHPPAPVCPKDNGKNVAPEAVSGRAKVASFTVNHQQWMPGLEVPYVIAIVEIAEQPDVRLTTNIVNSTPEEVTIGMDVQVCFEHHPDEAGDVWLPLFEPAGDRI